jgi:tRNA(Arg) A34 adenosine deaminase TadA
MKSQLNNDMGTPPVERQPAVHPVDGPDTNTDPATMPLEEFAAVQYHADGSFEVTATHLSNAELQAMDTALRRADDALASGNPPVGAVLLDRERGLGWEAATSDKTEGHLTTGHAEIVAYNMAQPTVKDELGECTLVTTCQLCSSCAPHFAEGKIGRIVYAASRREVWQATGGQRMRQRYLNMHHALNDGETETTVVGGVQRTEALGKFTFWAARQDVADLPDAQRIQKLTLLDEMLMTPQRAFALQIQAAA